MALRCNFCPTIILRDPVDAIELYGYSERLSECSGVLRGLLDHHQVRGKPILLLANKSDVDTAQVGHVTAILVPHWST